MGYPVSSDGARLCPKDQPQRVAWNNDLAKPIHNHCGALRLVLRTQPRSNYGPSCIR